MLFDALGRNAAAAGGRPAQKRTGAAHRPGGLLAARGQTGYDEGNKTGKENGQGRTAPRKRPLGFPASQTAMKIEHAALYVRDLEDAKEFFTRWFGAQAGAEYHNRTTDFRSYFLTFEGGARLEIMTRPGLADRAGAPAVGFAHLAFSVGSTAALTMDALLIIGMYSLCWGWMPFSLEVDQTFIGAILTAEGGGLSSGQRPAHHRRWLLRKLCGRAGGRAGGDHGVKRFAAGAQGPRA